MTRNPHRRRKFLAEAMDSRFMNTPPTDQSEGSHVHFPRSTLGRLREVSRSLKPTLEKEILRQRQLAIGLV
jgi:hypothetical protein